MSYPVDFVALYVAPWLPDSPLLKKISTLLAAGELTTAGRLTKMGNAAGSLC